MNFTALSVRQPWANLLVWGLKTIEVRSWSTNYRGPLLIHASKKVDEIGNKRFPMNNQALGAVVGQVDLIDVKPFTVELWSDLADSHLDLGPYFSGLYAWYVTNPIPFDEPIPFPGKTKLFRIDANGNNNAILLGRNQLPILHL